MTQLIVMRLRSFEIVASLLARNSERAWLISFSLLHCEGVGISVLATLLRLALDHITGPTPKAYERGEITH